MALAKIIEKYPDEFQNEGSATLLNTYYVNVAKRLMQDMDNRGYRNIELEVIAPTDTVS